MRDNFGLSDVSGEPPEPSADVHNTCCSTHAGTPDAYAGFDEDAYNAALPNTCDDALGINDTTDDDKLFRFDRTGHSVDAQPATRRPESMNCLATAAAAATALISRDRWPRGGADVRLILERWLRRDRGAASGAPSTR